MNNPKQFSKPCILTALATAMATPLSVVIRAPLANTIAACVGGKDAQSKVNSPLLMWRNTCGSLIDNDVDIYWIPDLENQWLLLLFLVSQLHVLVLCCLLLLLILAKLLLHAYHIRGSRWRPIAVKQAAYSATQTCLARIVSYSLICWTIQTMSLQLMLIVQSSHMHTYTKCLCFTRCPVPSVLENPWRETWWSSAGRKWVRWWEQTMSGQVNPSNGKVHAHLRQTV